MGKDLNGRKLPSGISQRPNGSYMGRVMYGGVTHTIYNRSLSELKKEMTDLRYSLEHGTYVTKSKVTLGDWVEEWLETYKAPSVKKSTIHSYETYLNYWKCLNKMKLSDINASCITHVLNDMVQQGYAQGTVKSAFVTLSNCLKYAFKTDLIESNPCDKVIVPKNGREKKESVALTREQERIFKEYAKDSYLCDYFSLILETGMRGGEASALTFADVDFKNKLIHVNHTIIKGGELGTPKTRTSRRQIPLTNTALEILKRRRDENREAQGNNIISLTTESDFVFTDNGELITHHRWSREINKIKTRIIAAGIDFPESFTLHSLRHTFATRAAEAGLDLNVLKNIMGHASLSMTADLYSHVMEDQKRIELDRIAAAL